MIHRSFKPAKCKTELKLAISRIKLLKNKRGAQLKQLKREVAQLLESGEVQNAKIRVEHVVKEEKTIAAYDLIEVYCELIAARMSIIESQKNCPIDLTEPVCGVIFASPRCSEIPELRKVSKQLTRKYSKEFLSAAVELRPDCGVNHLLVDKLSARGPDSQTKLKTLSAIAEEQNIKWDPQQLEEKNPNHHGDLRNGHATVEKVSNLHKESARGQAPPSHHKKEKSDIRPSHRNKMNMDPTEFLNNYDARWSFGSQNVSAAQNGVSKTLPSESRLSGLQDGNMEFKNAASAAQAAAESAELASIAARAAAELSSLGNTTGQGSNVSDTGIDHHARDEGTAHGARSCAQSEISDLASGLNDFVRSDSTVQQEEYGKHDEAYFAMTPEKTNHGSGNDRSSSLHSQSTSVESSTGVTHDDHLKSLSEFILGFPKALFTVKILSCSRLIVMEHEVKKAVSPLKGLLQSDELYKYILETSVYPREPDLLKELRDVTASHPRAAMGTAPDAGQMIAMLLNLISARRTIEIGVFTGYSLLLTALSIPEDGKIIAIDVNRESFDIGLPVIKKAGVENKIELIESEALPVLDHLLQNHENEGNFDFAFVDADKINYWNYHERLMKLLRVGGLAVYDNTLWRGSVAMPDSLVPEGMKRGQRLTIELNKLLAADSRVQLCHVPLGDGITICKRIS